MTAIDDLARHHLEERIRLDPVWATGRGYPGADDRLTDYSPAGIADRVALARRTLEALVEARVETSADGRAREAIIERLGAEIAVADAGEHLRQLRVIGSPAGAIRQCFDLMGQTTAEDWQLIGTRMAAVPAALAGVRAALEDGRAKGLVAARRQALACATQAATWAGTPSTPGYFRRLAARAPELPGLLATAEAADRSYGEYAAYLRGPYAKAASEIDGVGRDRYALAARLMTGAELDLDETYHWGWEELERVTAEMERTAAEVRPGASIEEAIAELEADPARVVVGEEALLRFLQDLMDRAVASLDGRHFDIPAPVRRVEARLAPEGGAAAMYYTGPSADFSRPGRTWYPTLGRTRFPTWVEVSTAYHEGVPGHHLQLATTVFLQDELNPLLGVVGSVSGHTEGWALYAERLMEELGFLADPGERLGMLAGERFRAARVVVDLGLHLGLPLPATAPGHPGEAWTPEVAAELLQAASGRSEEFVRSEVDRYLGWPAQAICYKVGQRVWQAVRREEERRRGDAFDLKDFHRRAFGLGMMGLDVFARQIAETGSEVDGRGQ